MQKIKLKGVWSEAARPKTFEDIILPERLKRAFRKMLKEKDIPNLLFVSPSPGTGKTTLAQILANELHTSFLYIKGSEDGGKDTIKYDINNFVNGANVKAFESDDSIATSFKIVYVDEADGSTPAFQKALRSTMNDYSKSCRFIFTCNFESDMIEQVLDRFTTIRFEFNDKEKEELAELFYYRVCSILTDNEIKFDEEVVANIIMSNVPRFRRIWDKLYEIYLNYGEITQESFNEEKELEGLIEAMNSKSYKKVIDCISSSSTLNFATIYSSLFNLIDKINFRSDILIYLLSEYSSKNNRTADKILNFCGFYSELCLRESGKI